MKKLIKQLEEFHEKFGLPIGSDETRGHCDPDQQALHYKLMLEELNEFKDKGCEKDDPVEVADGLGDVLFVLMSSVVAHGLQDRFEAVFDEICRSNMSKLGEDGKPIRREDGKIMRGEYYSRPNLAAIMYPPKVGDLVRVFGQDAVIDEIGFDRYGTTRYIIKQPVVVPTVEYTRDSFRLHEIEILNL